MRHRHGSHHHGRCAGATRGNSSGFVLSGTKPQYERNRPFLITHWFLDWELHPAEKALSGSATLTCKRVHPTITHLRLDAVGFEIKAVELDHGQGFSAMVYHYDGDHLDLDIDVAWQDVQIRVFYYVCPKRGMYFLAPDAYVQDRPKQVWTQCQDEDARYFIPCHDKPHMKQTSEIKVRVPPSWVALSNGILVEKRQEQAHAFFHWRMDHVHPSYLFALVAGEFAEVKGKQVGDVPLTYWVPPEQSSDAERTFGRTPAMMEYFQQLVGLPYPWVKYDQVVLADFTFGGMENTTITTLYEHTMLDERASLDISSDPLIAHELAHHWFGDYVTCRDWNHGWLNEGFATFFEHLDSERQHGSDEYLYDLHLTFEAYLQEAKHHYRRPIVCREYSAPIELFDKHLYEKGSLVLHMLRTKLGDDLFWNGIRHYLKKHAMKLVETRDLVRALEDTSGLSLEQFFDQWVFRAGHPQATVKIGVEKNKLVVEVNQTFADKDSKQPFEFPLEIQIGFANSTETMVFDITRESEHFIHVTSERPVWLAVNARYAVFGELDVRMPTDLARTALRSASSAAGRWSAAQILAKRDDEPTVQALATCLNNESEYWGVRAEAAHALSEIRSPSAREALVKATSVSHPKVRCAVVVSLGDFRHEQAFTALRPLALSDPSYLVEASAAQALGATRQAEGFDVLVSLLNRSSWADVIQSGTLKGLGALRDKRAIPHALAKSKYGNPQRARRSAIRMLPKLSQEQAVREHLEQLLEDDHPRVRSDVIAALVDMGDAACIPALRRCLERDNDPSVRRSAKEALLALPKDGPEQIRQLKSELETMRDGHRELKHRLNELEAKLSSKEPS
jgi:aminopeptidase N